jgi:DNA-binding MarR family transcriptional regulator
VNDNDHLANRAWETMFRAQATLAREFERSGEWAALLPREYGVLYALSRAPEGLRISELGEDVLLTQTGISRLITRMDERGLIERRPDPGDARACVVRLTDEGRRVQSEVGAKHARHVTRAMTRALDSGQLATLLALSEALLAAAQDPSEDAARNPREGNQS